ncbi:MAG: xanthine dehydrogenase family protein molybdopterin-binding subunit [Hyphomicrobiales bacterium]
MTDDVADSLRPKLVGARVLRVEDPRLLAGKGAYVDDHRIAGTLSVAFRRSDHAHARITAIDSAEAGTMPGVVAIVSAADIEAAFTPIRATSRMKNYHATEMRPLAHGKVRYVGEPVVAVVAENRYLAEDAAQLVSIDYEPLSDLVDAELAIAEGAALLHDDAASNVIAEREFARGDVDAAMDGAAVRVGARFRFRRKTPVAIENRAYLADYDDGRRALTLYSSTQVPGIIRDALCDALDMPGHRLRVVAPDVGGGFGGKASFYPEELLVCLLARRLARPVKWTGDRLEDLISTSQAFDEIIDAELGLDRDGTLLGLRADVIGDIGAYSIYPWTAVLEPVQVISFMPGPYRLENYRGRVRAVATTKAPGGPYRGVGRPISTFVMERLIDMAARKLELDPRDLRLRNLVAPEEFPYKAASGIVWDRSGFTECLHKTCEVADYDALRREQDAAREAGRWMGIGLASYAELTGIGSRISAAPGMPINTGTETATIRIDSSGAVTAFFGVASHGQGLETSLAQVLAEELGVRIEDVEVVMGDSATMAHGTGTYASRSTVLAGGAAILSAQAVRENVIKAAAHLLEAAETDIEVAGGKVQVIGTDRAMTMREVARAVYSEMGRFPKELREEISLEATRLYDPFFGTSTSATHLAVVEVDLQTCQVKVLRYVVSEDCGKVINPLIVDGQVHGGVAQGIGAALMEEVVHDDGGQILTASLVDYVVPSACEIPPIDVHHVESELPNTLGGFRGMGEGGTIGAPAAVANAVADALAPLGVEITEVPVTPERLFRLIEKARTVRKEP